MISPQLEVPPARPSRPTPEDEEALDEALRETFPASDTPVFSPPQKRKQGLLEKIGEVIQQVTSGWSPTTEPTREKSRQGEPPMPLEDAEHLAREPLTLIPWSFREERYDEVDEAVAESFPASDPPSWTTGR